MSTQFEHIQAPLHRYTFSVSAIRSWVEQACQGRTLNLFAGKTLLALDEVRNDLDSSLPADHHQDALTLIRTWRNGRFDTILLDPPYALRKSMELYNGMVCSPFRQLKDALPALLNAGGRVVTFGYHSVVMGQCRGFELERLALFSHGGAIHDTIATVERLVKGGWS